ncbi:MAG: TonB-dependent receptor plug domain-containing protein [Bacteroidota bacterium]
MKEKTLEEVKIMDLLYRTVPKLSYKMTQEDVLKRQPEDLGDLLRSFPGITLKNYGGLGGLKTISARGINGSHTGIIIDGFLVQNAQTGQIDLGNVQVENSTEIKFSYAVDEHKLQPVSAYFNASNLWIETFENQFSADTLQLRFTSKYGSYGQLDNYLSAKWNRKKAYVSVFGRYRQARGNFPFTVSNFNEILSAKRYNNDLQEVFAGFSLGKLFENDSRLKFTFSHNFSDKGLPGAVILYNPVSAQRLSNSNVTSNLDYRFRWKKQYGRTYLGSRYDELVYLDSAYLNQQGFLKSVYFNTNVLGGAIFKYSWNKKTLIYGLEEQYAYLKSNSFAEDVHRYHSKALLQLNIDRAFWLIELTSGVQHVYNTDRSQQQVIEKWSFNPGISVYSKRPVPILQLLRLTLKRTMRMPAFNELYYSQVGNLKLKPEIANQSNFGSDINFDIHKNKFKISYNFFGNYIENKIVAIPTKNLFVWSIQNVGKVWIYGADLLFEHERRIDELKLNTSFNYTFQRVLDYSDPNSTTFKDQVAYMPVHLLNASFSLNYKNAGLNVSGNYTSLRYALNENVGSNEVSGFYTCDASLYMLRSWKDHRFRLAVTVKNLTGTWYEYIRNYVMPGRNYLISFSYAIH